MTQPAHPRPATFPEAPPSTSLNPYPVPTRRPSAASLVSVTLPSPTASCATPNSSSGSTETSRDYETAHSAIELSATTRPTHSGVVPKRSTDDAHDVEEAQPLEGAARPFPATEAPCPSQRRMQRTRKSTDTPFAWISDHELYILLHSHEITNPNILPLEIFDRMICNQVTSMHDWYETGNDTDNFLQNALKIKNPVSKYFSTASFL